MQVWGPFSRNAAEDVAFVEETHKCQEFGANKYDVPLARRAARGSLATSPK